MLQSEDENIKDYGTKEGDTVELPEARVGGRWRVSSLQLSVLSAISGFLFGYDTGVVSGAMLMIRDQFPDITVAWHEAIVGATVASAAVFALSGGALNNRIGRKPVIQISSVLFCMGSVLLAAAQSKYTLLIGRLIVGAAIGFGSMTVPMYISEAAAEESRGFMATINQLMITFGMMISCIVDALFSYKRPDGWRYMLGLAFIPAFIQWLCFFGMPESPRWLVEKGEQQKAVNVLLSIRRNNDAAMNEWQSIKDACDSNREASRAAGRFPLVKMLRIAAIRRMLIVGCALQLFQQICGINTIMYYSSTIFRMSGYSNASMDMWLSSLVASVNFVFTLVALTLVDRVGRRKLTIYSLIGVTFSLIFIGMSFQLQEKASAWQRSDSLVTNSNQNDSCVLSVQNPDCMTCITAGPSCTYCLNPEDNRTSLCFNPKLSQDDDASCPAQYRTTECPSSYSWLTVLGFILYLMCFAPGMGPMPWTINSELYPQWARSNGNACSTFVNWVANSFVSLTFLSLMQTITKHGTFYMYGILSAIGVIFFWWTLPETKGLSLEQVEHLFDKPWLDEHKFNEHVQFHNTHEPD